MPNWQEVLELIKKEYEETPLDKFRNGNSKRHEMIRIIAALAMCLCLMGCIGVGGGHIGKDDDGTLRWKAWIFGLSDPQIAIKDDGYSMSFQKNDATDNVERVIVEGLNTAKEITAANKGVIT